MKKTTVLSTIIAVALLMGLGQLARAENLKELLDCNNGALSLYRDLDRTPQNSDNPLIMVIRDSALIFRLQHDLGLRLGSTFRQDGFNASGDQASESQNNFARGPSVSSARDLKTFVSGSTSFVTRAFRSAGGLQIIYQATGLPQPVCQGGEDDHEGHCLGGTWVATSVRQLSDWFYPNCQER